MHKQICNSAPFSGRTTLQGGGYLGLYISSCSAANTISAAASLVSWTSRADDTASVNHFYRSRKARGRSVMGGRGCRRQVAENIANLNSSAEMNDFDLVCGHYEVGIVDGHLCHGHP